MSYSFVRVSLVSWTESNTRLILRDANTFPVLGEWHVFWMWTINCSKIVYKAMQHIYVQLYQLYQYLITSFQDQYQRTWLQTSNMYLGYRSPYHDIWWQVKWFNVVSIYHRCRKLPLFSYFISTEHIFHLHINLYYNY